MAAETDTLRRTPLHGRHAAAGAKLVPFAGWEMPVQYAGIREEHTAVREHVGIFDVSHMGQVETSGPGALELLQRLLSNDVAKIAEGGAQYSVLCNEQGGVLDDLFTYRLGPDRYLTVTNAANHERDLAWFQRHAADRDDVTVSRSDRRLRDARGAGAGGARARSPALTDGELPRRFTTAERTVAGVPDVLVCGTGYTGEDGVELLIAPQHAGAVWDAVVAAGATPVGLGARDTLRLEACFHLYGNDLSEDRGPIEAGLGWCCKEATGFIGAERVARDRAAGHRRAARPVRDHRPGHRPPGQPGRRRRRRHVRHALADARLRGRARLPAGRPHRAGHRLRDRRAREGPRRRSPHQATHPRGALKLADASYPSDLSYHEEHDWARIDGDVATFGITWYAQDQLGEVVFFDPPEVGKTVRKGDPYAEVESVKAVSDVIAPLSGEIVEVNDALGSGPEAINEDPYDTGWMVRVRLSDPSELDTLMDAAAYQESLS